MQRRRGWLIAFALALLATVTTNIVVPDICQYLTPDDTFLWWWNNCGKDASGGGGGGAGD